MRTTKTIFFIWQTLYGGVHGLIDMKLNDRFRIVQLYHGVVRFIELYICIHCQSISIREYRRGNRKWTIQRNWQHSVHKTKTNKTKRQHNMCWTPIQQANTNNVNKTRVLLQTTGGKDEPNIVSFLCGNRNGHHNKEVRT